MAVEEGGRPWEAEMIEAEVEHGGECHPECDEGHGGAYDGPGEDVVPIMDCVRGEGGKDEDEEGRDRRMDWREEGNSHSSMVRAPAMSVAPNTGAIMSTNFQYAA